MDAVSTIFAVLPTYVLNVTALCPSPKDTPAVSRSKGLERPRPFGEPSGDAIRHRQLREGWGRGGSFLRPGVRLAGTGKDGIVAVVIVVLVVGCGGGRSAANNAQLPLRFREFFVDSVD